MNEENTPSASDSSPDPASGAQQSGPALQAAAPVTAVEPAPSRPGRWAGILAILALAGAGAAGWQAWSGRADAGGLRTELARRLADSDAAITAARAAAVQQQEAIASLQGKLGALEAKVEATEGQAASLEALYQEFSRSREDRVIAEVEQAVAMAAQELQITGAPEIALIALQGAEARLAADDRGQLAPLRRALAKDIEQLRLMPVVNAPDVALRLERLLESTDTLPLAFASKPEAAPESAVPPAQAAEGTAAAVLDFAAALARDVWRELRGLVRIERLDQAEPVLLAPEQSAFLRENLRVRLLTARLALLARDGRTYAADLAQARGWIERFFDPRNEQVKTVLNELRALEAVPLSAARPTLSESLNVLRLLQTRAGELRPTAPPPPADGARAPQ